MTHCTDQVLRTRRKARFAPPYCLEPRRQMLPIQTERPNYREWRCRVAPGIEVIVGQSNKSHASESVDTWVSFWWIKGLDGYRHERPVLGGPQQAANEATRELRKIARLILGGGYAS